jgi:hypothetical protein
VREVLGENVLEVPVPENEEAVQALSPDRPHETFGEGVRTWCLDRGLDDPEAFSAEHLIEAGAELRVSVPDKELGCSGPL